MKKMIGKIMLGIITAGTMAASQAAEFSRFEYESRGAPGAVVYNLTIDFDKRILITQESNSSKPKKKNHYAETGTARRTAERAEQRRRHRMERQIQARDASVRRDILGCIVCSDGWNKPENTWG